jgi:polar amino acid transport system substrate-binding protein
LTNGNLMKHVKPNHRYDLLWMPVVVVILAVLGCSKREDKPVAVAVPPAPQKPATTTVYRVGIDPAYPPFESLDSRGDMVGFDIDLVRAIARRAGFEVKILSTPWSAIFDLLAQGERDMLASAISINDERRRTMDFSAPYYESVQLVAIARNKRVARFSDLKALTLGVQAGSYGDDVASRLLGPSSTKIKRFDSARLALVQLDNGGVDAVVADSGPILHFGASASGFKWKTLTDDTLMRQSFAIAVKKGNAELLQEVDRALAELRASGEYAAIAAKYFAAADSEAPVRVQVRSASAAVAAPTSASR